MSDGLTPLCGACNKSWEAHSTATSLKEDSDPPGTWYTEDGERCPDEWRNCIWSEPDDWTLLDELAALD